MGDAATTVVDKVQDAVPAVESVANTVVMKASSFIGNAVDDVESKAMDVLHDLDRLTSVNEELTGTFDIEQHPSNSDTRWGRAYKLYEGNGLKAYCVGCGVSGKMTLKGSISFSIAHGFSTGKISTNGNLNGVAQLGVEAELDLQYSVPEQVIAQVALSDLVLAGVLQIGPAVKLSAGADIDFNAQGNLLAGVVLDWPAVSASIDIASTDGTQVSGWQPKVKPVFQADASVTVQAEPYTKIALEMTLSLLEGRFSKSIALVDQPSIVVEANVAGKTGFADGKMTAEFTNGCAGVAVRGQFRNQVYVDLAGYSRKELVDWSSDPVTKCLGKRTKRNTLQTRQDAVLPLNASETTVSVVYSIMHSHSGNLDVHAAHDGNLYAMSSKDSEDPAGEDSAVTSSLFESLDNTIIGDSRGRILHGYHDTFEQWGISRLRFSDLGSIPQTARMIQLEPADNPIDTKEEALGVMVAKDTAAEVYLLATCVFEDLYPKLFAIKHDDVDAKLDLLMSKKEEVVKYITGPGVQHCGLVPFGNGIDKE